MNKVGFIILFFLISSIAIATPSYCDKKLDPKLINPLIKTLSTENIFSSRYSYSVNEAQLAFQKLMKLGPCVLQLARKHLVETDQGEFVPLMHNFLLIVFEFHSLGSLEAENILIRFFEESSDEQCNQFTSVLHAHLRRAHASKKVRYYPLIKPKTIIDGLMKVSKFRIDYSEQTEGIFEFFNSIDPIHHPEIRTHIQSELSSNPTSKWGIYALYKMQQFFDDTSLDSYLPLLDNYLQHGIDQDIKSYILTFISNRGERSCTPTIQKTLWSLIQLHPINNSKKTLNGLYTALGTCARYTSDVSFQTKVHDLIDPYSKSEDLQLFLRTARTLDCIKDKKSLTIFHNLIKNNHKLWTHTLDMINSYKEKATHLSPLLFKRFQETENQEIKSKIARSLGHIGFTSQKFADVLLSEFLAMPHHLDIFENNQYEYAESLLFAIAHGYRSQKGLQSIINLLEKNTQKNKWWESRIRQISVSVLQHHVQKEYQNWLIETLIKNISDPQISDSIKTLSVSTLREYGSRASDAVPAILKHIPSSNHTHYAEYFWTLQIASGPDVLVFKYLIEKIINSVSDPYFGLYTSTLEPNILTNTRVHEQSKNKELFNIFKRRYTELLIEAKRDWANQALRDFTFFERLRLIKFLATFQLKETALTLTEGLWDPNVHIRRQTVDALISQDKNSESVLRPLLTTRDDFIRFCIASALTQIPISNKKTKEAIKSTLKKEPIQAIRRLLEIALR